MAKRDTFNEINITPLTDIFLVLLVIMMVIAPMLDQQGLNLVVPDNIEVTEMPESSHILNIVVSNDDKYYCNEEEISPEQIQNFIKEQAANDTEFKGVLIQTEDDATHGAVVKLMDSARNVGVVNISLSEL